jgi:hypothetical protein
LPPLGGAELRRVLFQAKDGPRGPSVAALFSRCSHGATRLTAATSRLAQPVRLPCRGAGWAFGSAADADLAGLADAADAAVAAQQGLAPAAFRHTVYLLPRGAGLAGGYARMGCGGGGPCRAWVGSDSWGDPQVGRAFRFL